MKFRVTLDTALTVTKYAIAPIASWPLSPDASPSNILCHSLYWWFAIVHLLVSSSGWFYNIYENRHDADVVVRCLAEVCALSSTIVKMIICKIEANHIESLLTEMKMFRKQATSDESKLIQFYVDKCIFSHTVVLIPAVLGPLAYILGPTVLAQPLPGDTAYPFSLEPFWTWTILYISHSLIVMQAGCMAILDFMFAILLWYTGIRFEMLCIELERATNADDVTRCIRKHQELLEYVERLKVPIRIMAFEVTVVAIFAVTVGGFVLMRNPSAFVVAKYLCFNIVSAMELFLFAWPADNLIDMSERIKDAAFGCDWVGKSPKMTKNLIIIMQRSRVPSVIDVKGVLPALSLQLYGSAMSTSFSYLTTLRAMAVN